MIDGTDDEDISHRVELMPPQGRFETSREALRIEERKLEVGGPFLRGVGREGIVLGGARIRESRLNPQMAQ